MTWVRLDDSIPTHPKMLGLDAASFGLFIEAICYCNQHLTDGTLPRHSPGTLRFFTKSRFKKLTDLGLIDKNGDGYIIHDYLEYQPSKARIQAERDQARDRQERWRQRNRNAVTNADVTPLVTATQPNPTQEYPLTPASGGTDLQPKNGNRGSGTSPREIAATAKRNSKRAAAIAACRRDWDRAKAGDEYLPAVRESLERDYRHDPSIVTEAIGAA